MDRIAVAEQLICNGLPRSALSLLLSIPLHGSRINRLRSYARRLSQTPRIQPGIYALATYGDLGVAAPLLASIERPGGRHSRLEIRKNRSLSHASTAARLLMDSSAAPLPDFPILSVPGISLEGDSIGLAAALAFLMGWSGRRPESPVLATGCLTPEGHVHPVDGIRAKLEAATLEIGGTDAIILIPAGGEELPSLEGVQPIAVRTLEEAVRRVWGVSRLAADLRILGLRELLDRVENEPDPQRALAALESYTLEGLPPADRARVLLQRSVVHRHLGDTERALEFQEKVLGCLEEEIGALGVETVELIEVQSFANSLDLFQFDMLEPLLRIRLAAPFASPHNRVRCRGILAQVVSTAAFSREAIRLRKDNLAAQAGSDEMRREIPRTLSSLVYEAARAGRQAEFEGHVPLLLRETPPRNDSQQAYNSFGIARGLVCLRRAEDLFLWVTRKKRLWDAQPPGPLTALLDMPGEIRGYPAISTARALARAFRNSGLPELAAALSHRIRLDSGSGLVPWLALLTLVEGALAQHEAGRRDSAASRIRFVVPRLKTLHPQAAAYHRPLIALLEAWNPDSDEDRRRIELGLDRVYY